MALISGGEYMRSPIWTRAVLFSPFTTWYGTSLISSVTSLWKRPMKRLMENTVFCEFVTAWRFAACPTNRSPVLVNATTEGVNLDPSELGMTAGAFPSMNAATELVVPKSIPIIFPAIVCSPSSVRMPRNRVVLFQRLNNFENVDYYTNYSYNRRARELSIIPPGFL